MGKLILILGGARSGKSAFAEKKTRELALEGNSGVCYIATARAGDSEMAERISRHRARRPADWRTIEEQVDLCGAMNRLEPGEKVVLLDCMTLWVTNVMFGSKCHEKAENELENGILGLLDEFLDVVAASDTTVVAVSGETGMGIVPSDRVSRLFRDLLGIVNQKMAEASWKTYFIAAGLPMELK